MNTTAQRQPGTRSKSRRNHVIEARQNAPNTNGDDAFATHWEFAESLQRRATHPYRGSLEYQRAIAECMAAHKARRTPVRFALSSKSLDLGLVARIIVLMILVNLVIWIGTQLVMALPNLAAPLR